MESQVVARQHKSQSRAPEYSLGWFSKAPSLSCLAGYFGTDSFLSPTRTTSFAFARPQLLVNDAERNHSSQRFYFLPVTFHIAEYQLTLCAALGLHQSASLDGEYFDDEHLGVDVDVPEAAPNRFTSLR